MKLHELKPAAGSRKKKRRLGRGPGSGRGKTAGRGEKGQRSRSGYSSRGGFEGGQMPLHRRLPKRGFTNIFRTECRVVNVGRLNGFESGMVVTSEALESAGLLKKGSEPVKVLGNGEVKVALTVRVDRISDAAAKKIEAAGGKVEMLTPKRGRK